MFETNLGYNRTITIIITYTDIRFFYVSGSSTFVYNALYKPTQTIRNCIQYSCFSRTIVSNKYLNLTFCHI